MRFAIIGAGAIGAYVGAKLARSGEDVLLIARGRHLDAMKDHGVRVHSPDGDFEVRTPATDDWSAAGTFDYILLTVKAHSLTELAPRLAPLVGPETAIVSTQNGMPWWYFQRLDGPSQGTHLEMTDPGGVVSRSIDPHRVIGCVVYPATLIVKPGVIRHVEGDRLAIGEPDGTRSERCKRLSAALNAAGFRCPIRRNIRHDIWVKLAGNAAFNPISALTGATLLEIASDQDGRALARLVMAEAYAVAEALGVNPSVTIDQRLAGAEKVGHHKTSMLQDAEAGRPMELDSVVGVVVELGEKLGIPTPHTRTLYASAKLLAKQLARGHR